MNDNYYELPKYKKEKIYLPYRCTNCYKILRIKIFAKDNIIKYNCQCKNEWLISFDIDSKNQLDKVLRKPKHLDSNLLLRCSFCNHLPNIDFKYLQKCLICRKLICSRESCKEKHFHQNYKNLNVLDVICDKHSKDFISYCKTCDRDLCEICALEEKNHDILYYKDILPKKDEFIKKYNFLNEFSNLYVKSFKGVRRKTNMRLIYFFHFREIIRNIFFNLSRFSKFKKFNFALISNFLENSDFLDEDPLKLDLNNLDFKLFPTYFLNSSKYHFDFLENQNKTIINFFNEKKNIEILFFYVSSPNKKYFIIGENNKEKKLILYNSKTFSILYTRVIYSNIEKYFFEDNRLLFTLNNFPKKIFLLFINSENNKILKDNFVYKEIFNNVQPMKDSFLIQKNNEIKILKDKGTHEILDIISLGTKGQIIEDALVFGEMLIYGQKSDKFNLSLNLIDTKTKINCGYLNIKNDFNSYLKIDDRHLFIICNDKNFYLINATNLQIINHYKTKHEEFIISNNYFISYPKNQTKNIKILNILNSKYENKFNYFFCFDFNGRGKINELVFIKNIALSYWSCGLFYLNSYSYY